MFRFLWTSTRGHRLRPWDSPYLKWRIETYWGVNAEQLTSREVIRFARAHSAELLRFLRWAAAMNAGRSRQAGSR